MKSFLRELAPRNIKLFIVHKFSGRRSTAVVVGPGEKTVMNDSSDSSTAREEGPHTPEVYVVCQWSLPAAPMNAAAAVESDDSEELSQWEMVSVQETGHRYPEERV